MHELSIAKSLIEMACDYAESEGANRVTQISIRLGSESIVFRSLYFCFDAAANDTLCEGALLDIEEVPLSAHCPACNEVKFLPCRTSFRCPDCGTPTPNILTGREMQLVSLNLEYPENSMSATCQDQQPSTSGEHHEH